jgi:hypothetical protein
LCSTSVNIRDGGEMLSDDRTELFVTGSSANGEHRA